MPPSYCEEEEKYYSWLFALCDLDHNGVISVDPDKKWLHDHCGLEPDVLDQV